MMLGTLSDVKVTVVEQAKWLHWSVIHESPMPSELPFEDRLFELPAGIKHFSLPLRLYASHVQVTAGAVGDDCLRNGNLTSGTWSEQSMGSVA